MQSFRSTLEEDDPVSVADRIVALTRSAPESILYTTPCDLILSMTNTSEPKAIFNDLPNEIVARIVSLAISKPILNCNENLQGYEQYSDSGSLPKRQAATTCDFKTAHDISKVSKVFRDHVLNAFQERVRDMAHTVC